MNHLKSDRDLKAYLAKHFPAVSFRYRAEWNEYQLTIARHVSGHPDYDRGAYITKPADRADQAEARQDVIDTARLQQSHFDQEFPQ